MLTFDTHLLCVDEPTCPINIVDMVASDQAAHAIRQAINHTLLPYLHLRPVKSDRFCHDAHRSQFFLTVVIIALAS